MLDEILTFGAAGVIIFAVVMFIITVRTRYIYSKKPGSVQLNANLLAEIYSMRDVEPLDACDVLYNHHYKTLVRNKLDGKSYNAEITTTNAIISIKNRLLREAVASTH